MSMDMHCLKCRKKVVPKNIVHLIIYENYGSTVRFMCIPCYKKLRKSK